jgi:hypothetical protein
MKGKNRKRVLQATVIAVIIIFVISLAYLAGLFTPKTQGFVPHYLTYQGVESKIYFSEASSSYTTANQTYVASNGQTVTKGSQLFVLNLTLRNDYSSDNPPPYIDNPIAPVDGTTYICLNSTLYGKDGVVNAVNVSPSDYAVQSSDQTGLVLASGQTSTIRIYLKTENVSINEFTVNLVFLGDRIPTQ